MQSGWTVLLPEALPIGRQADLSVSQAKPWVFFLFCHPGMGHSCDLGGKKGCCNSGEWHSGGGPGHLPLQLVTPSPAHVKPGVYLFYFMRIVAGPSWPYDLLDLTVLSSRFAALPIWSLAVSCSDVQFSPSFNNYQELFSEWCIILYLQWHCLAPEPSGSALKFSYWSMPKAPHSTFIHHSCH